MIAIYFCAKLEWFIRKQATLPLAQQVSFGGILFDSLFIKSKLTRLNWKGYCLCLH